MKRLLLCALVLLFLLSLLTGVTQVQPGERAVIFRFGRPLAERPRPGLYVGLPWGIDRVERVPIELVRRVTVGYDERQPDEDAQIMPAGQMLTGDHHLVNVQVVLDYSVVEDEVEQYVVQAERVDALVARAAETVLAEWLAGRSVDEVLLTGKRLLPRWVAEKTQQRIAPYQLGIKIQDSYVTHLYPPADVKTAFDDVTRAQAEVQTRLLEAEQEADRRWREALSEKFRGEQQAQAYRKEQLLLAHAEVEGFAKRLAAYQEFRRRDPLLPRLGGRTVGLLALGGPLPAAAALVPGCGDDGKYLNALWWDEMSRLYARMRETGRIDVLDTYLGADGLDITQVPTVPKKK